MMTAARVCVVVVCLVASGVPAAAKQSAAARVPLTVTSRVPVATTGRSAPLQIQTGTNNKATLPQAKTAPFKPLQLPVTPRKPESTGPVAPSLLPDYNPLKRRHMAMPGAPDTEYAF